MKASSLNSDQCAELLASLTDEEAALLNHDWHFWCRDTQQEPEGLDWTTWLILAGRGFGKTRTGAETVRGWVESGRYGRIALVAETAGDARDVMVEGESGILAVSPPWNRPKYEPSKRRLTWPNGARATLYSGEEPDQLRGPQHDAAWSDEIAKWRYAQDAWDQLQFGLRLGNRPIQIVTTTPRPIPVVKSILKDPLTHVTRGRTVDNASNLAATFMAKIVKRFEGTRLGRQELDAEILDDVEGALWTWATMDACPVLPEDVPDLQRVVVAIDPSGTAGKADKRGDDVGIVAAGLGVDGHGYILADRTCNLPPLGWARRAVETFHLFKADAIVAEGNFGGEMVRTVVETADPNIRVRLVTASRGKVVRAEPVAALYEKGLVHHVGRFPELEDQMANFSTSGYLGERSPDRADAMIWAVTELMIGTASEPGIFVL